jgi:hypothetical protein
MSDLNPEIGSTVKHKVAAGAKRKDVAMQRYGYLTARLARDRLPHAAVNQAAGRPDEGFATLHRKSGAALGHSPVSTSQA